MNQSHVLTRQGLALLLVKSRRVLGWSQSQLVDEWGITLDRLRQWEEPTATTKIPRWVFYALVGSLLGRGKLLIAISELLPQTEKTKFGPVELPPSTHWYQKPRR